MTIRKSQQQVVTMSSQCHNKAKMLVGALLLATIACASAYTHQHQQQQHQYHHRATLAARRAADDSRPLATRLQREASHEAPVVVGKFRAPAPERMHRHRIAKSSDSSTQVLSASYQVADANDVERVVHGVHGMQAADSAPRSAASTASGAPQKTRKDQRTVSARIQVSDEGLNYPPSKLSADIHGNVAEIVTAPPEAVDNDFLVETSKMFGARRPN